MDAINEFFKQYGAIIVTAIVSVLATRFAPWLAQLARNGASRAWAYLSGRGRDYEIERKYLNALITRHRYLGQLPVNVASRLKSHSAAVALEQAFVSLQLTASVAYVVPDLRADDFGLLVGREKQALRTLSLSKGRWLLGKWMRRETQPQSDLGRALAQHPRLVIRGDPGSGKTTLLKYLAVTCARVRRNNREEGDARDMAKQRLGWDARPFPIFVSLGRHGNVATWERAHTLLDACADEFEGDFPAAFFERRLKQGGCLVLLDAFDELGGQTARSALAQKVERLLTQYHASNRVVVTTRVVGYEGQLDRLGFAVQTVQSLSAGQARALVQQRYRAIALRESEGESAETQAQAQRDADKRAAQLLDELQRNPRVRELAVNPLLLTLIVMVRQVKTLPDERHYLYHDCVRILTDEWRRKKRDDLYLSPPADDKLTLDQKLALLQALALAMQTRRTSANGGQSPLPRREAQALIAAQLPRFMPVRDGQTPDYAREADEWLEGIRQESGILEEVGPTADDALIRFSHLTFQEYLAAVALRAERDLPPQLLDNLLNETWQEVLLLYMAIAREGMAHELAQRLLATSNEGDTRGLFIAARCLADKIALGDLEQRIRDAIQQQLSNGEAKARVQFLELLAKAGWPEFTQTLLQLAEQEPNFAVRYAAAQALGRLGDPRFERDEPTMVTIPDDGSFTMGSEDSDKEAYDDEKPAHQLTLPTYAIGKYPVTNMEYQRFVEATGHRAPYDWEDGHYPAGKANHPVVNVSWRDAQAYCQWLSAHTGKRYCLPTEAEWEKTARGSDSRRYPWGNEFDKTKCNSGESGIGDTTPVGLYLEGASPYGALDMAGNVWEWCSSEFKPYPYDAKDGREDLRRDARRVVRGGSFIFFDRYMRCASRSRTDSDSILDIQGLRVVLLRSHSSRTSDL